MKDISKETPTMKEIVEQLESCKYKCIGGNLENNIAFIQLKKIADSSYQTRHRIGETVFTEDGIKAEVISLKGEYSSREGAQIVVNVCKNIYQDSKFIKHKNLLTPSEHKDKEIKEALKTLETYGYKANK